MTTLGRMLTRRIRHAALVTTIAVVCLYVLAGAHLPEVGPVDLQLDGPGTNVDDPCFWANPADPNGSLLFATTKDSGLVEVFQLATGAPVVAIAGFVRPNNCTVESDLLLTPDRDAPDVKVHHLPDLTYLRSFAQDMLRPMGVTVLHAPDGRALAYVTDGGGDASVHVYDLATGALVRTFPTGFGQR